MNSKATTEKRMKQNDGKVVSKQVKANPAKPAAKEEEKKQPLTTAKLPSRRSASVAAKNTREIESDQ